MIQWNLKVNVTSLLLTVGLVLMLFMWNGQRKDANRHQRNYQASQTELNTYVSEMDGVVVSYQQSLELTSQELLEALESDSTNLELVSHYKKLSGAVEIITEFKHDTLYIPVPELLIPDTTVKYADMCLELDLSLSNGFIGVNDINISNTLNMVSGKRKLGFFKGTEYSVDVRNTNPCLVTTGITHYEVVHKRKWWENPLIVAPIGFAVGYLVKD